MATALTKPSELERALAKAETPKEKYNIAQISLGVGKTAMKTVTDPEEARQIGNEFFSIHIDGMRGIFDGEKNKPPGKGANIRAAKRNAKGQLKPVSNQFDTGMSPEYRRLWRKVRWNMDDGRYARLKAAIKKLPHGEICSQPFFEVAKLDHVPQEMVIEKLECGRAETVTEAIKAVKDELKQKAREQMADEARERVDDNQGVTIGRFQEMAEQLEDNSVEFIFTDPPYDRDSVPMYSDLAEVAARVLVPGGSLITYLGMLHLPEVVSRLSERLHYLWPIAIIHTGPSLRMVQFGIANKWKPLLWFVKGTNRFEVNHWVDDLVVSEPEKQAHEWQQGLIEAGYYIEHLSSPGGLVFDPFCGGGTTALAAKRLGRRWFTCETDEDSAAIARSRILDG